MQEIRATHIRMKQNYLGTSAYQTLEGQLLEIDEIFLIGVSRDGWYKKEKVHDYVNHGNEISVDIYPNPILIAAVSINNEKYVRSTPNDSTQDNLLSLPRG